MPQTRYFHNYNLNKETPYSTLIADVSLGIYGANNAKQIADLRAAGGAYRIAQYWNGNGGEHGGLANAPRPIETDTVPKLKSNNIIGINGINELLRLLTDKRDWFVQYPNGDIVESMGRWAGNMYFNLLNPEFLAYWLQQISKHMLPDASAVFLDNLSAEGFTAMSPEPIFTATYGAGDSTKFLDAQVNFLKVTKNHLTGIGKKLYANVSRSHKNPDYFKAMCEHLDGVMIEHAFSEQTLTSDLDLIHWLTSHGKEVFIVCGVEPHETEAIERYTACYKLIECPLTYIRYSQDDAYSKWWIPQYSRDVEQLVSPNDFLQKQGDIAFRDYHGGYVWVNVKTREYGLEFVKPKPIQPKRWTNPSPYSNAFFELMNDAGFEMRVLKDGATVAVMQVVK